MMVGEVQARLRDAGVVVHHVTSVPSDADGPQVVIYLEGYLCQAEFADRQAWMLLGVNAVTFSSLTRTIMYVRFGGPSDGDSTGQPIPQGRSAA